MNPIWPAPPAPPMPPPSGCAPPSCFDWISKANSCWDQSQQLTDFLTNVIEDIFQQNPGIIPPPPPSAGTGPIIGVTDGSDAAPGEVGEFVTAFTSFNFAAYPTDTAGSVSVLVVQPGDWDLRVFTNFSTAIGGVAVYLSPSPAGISNNMFGSVTVLGTTTPDIEGVYLIGATARGNFTVPTLLAFSYNVLQSQNSVLAAGTGTVTVEGRRLR
jgi:hypothetical protein